MESVELGASGIHVTRVCLGTWQAFGWNTSDDRKISEVIQAALELGVNFIDTAPAYGNGHSERVIGKALKGKRETVVLATKVTHNNCRPDKLRKSLEQSLKNLQTDYVDLLQQHWPGKSPALEDTIGELEKLKEEGKIRAIGVSNWEEKEWGEIEAPHRIDSFQPCYNLLWRRIEKSVLPLCRENQIGVIAYSPLCQGLLTGRFKEQSTVPNDTRKNNVLRSKELFPEVLTLIDVLERIAEKNNRSCAETALQWVLQQHGITSVIVGCSKTDHIETAIKASSELLPADDVEELSKKSALFIQKTEQFKSLWNWHPRR